MKKILTLQTGCISMKGLAETITKDGTEIITNWETLELALILN